MTGNLSDEDFLHVFDEMSRICGDSASIRVLQLIKYQFFTQTFSYKQASSSKV